MMITINVQLSEGIRCILKETPSTVVVQIPEPMTVKQLALDIGIPPILIAFAIADGEKKSLDDVVESDASIHFFGTMAGG